MEVVQAAVSKFFEVNRQTLCQEIPPAPPDADSLLALQRNQMHAAHRLVCGQELFVIFQVWQPVPGHVTQRQLCPLVTYGGAQNKASFTEQLDTTTPSKMEPVFQFFAGQKYYLSFLIQNRDPTSLKKLPFTDCIEVCACMYACISLSSDACCCAFPDCTQYGRLIQLYKVTALALKKSYHMRVLYSCIVCFGL